MPRNGGRGGGSAPNFKWREWSNGGKNKNQKNSLHQNVAPKESYAESLRFKKSLQRIVFCSQNYASGIRGHCHKSSDWFEYPKKSLLKSSSTQKNTSIIPVTLKSGVPPPPPGIMCYVPISLIYYHDWNVKSPTGKILNFLTLWDTRGSKKVT